MPGCDRWMLGWLNKNKEDMCVRAWRLSLLHITETSVAADSFCFHAISSGNSQWCFFSARFSRNCVRVFSLVSISIKVVKAFVFAAYTSLHALHPFLFPASEVNPVLNCFYLIWWHHHLNWLTEFNTALEWWTFCFQAHVCDHFAPPTA